MKCGLVWKKRTKILTPASSYLCVNAMCSKHESPASPKASSPPFSHSPSPSQRPAQFSVSTKLKTLCKSHCRGRPAELCSRNPLRPPCLSQCLGDCTSQQTQLAASTAGAHPTGDASTNEAVCPPGDLTLSTPAWPGLSLVSRGRE